MSFLRKACEASDKPERFVSIGCMGSGMGGIETDLAQQWVLVPSQSRRGFDGVDSRACPKGFDISSSLYICNLNNETGRGWDCRDEIGHVLLAIKYLEAFTVHSCGLVLFRGGSNDDDVSCTCPYL